MKTSFEILGVRMEQRGTGAEAEIWLCPSVSFYFAGRTLTGTIDGERKFCTLDEYYLKSDLDEERFCKKIARRFVRQYRWRAALTKLKTFFKFMTKARGQI